MSTLLSASLSAAEDAFANNATFRAWCGAVDNTDAKANYIFSEDAVPDEADLPDKYVVIAEVENWSYERVGEGSGSGNFQLSGGMIKVTFQEALSAGEDWTATNRITFKDFVWNQIQPFIDAYEDGVSGVGFRIMSIDKMAFDDLSNRLRVIFDVKGRKGYNYVWEVELGVI